MVFDAFFNKFFGTQPKKYTEGSGPVRYLDAGALARPLDMQRKDLAIMGGFLVVAVIVGAVLLHNVLDATVNAPAREAESVQASLARDVSYDLPILSALMTQDNDAVRQTFADAGFTVYDKTSEETNAKGGVELIKLPSDVSEAEAAVYYAQGVKNLSAADAARLLKGSWTLSIDRSEYTDMRVRFADFASGSVDAAIDAAIVAEGLEEAPVTDSGTDDAGNTFKEGTVDVDGTTYTWRVSAIALSSVYKISGLPDTATYVGIRMTP